MKKQKKGTIGIIYQQNEDKKFKTGPEFDRSVTDNQTGEIVTFITNILRKHGYSVRALALTRNDLSNLKKLKVDFVFNLVDSRGLEIRIAKILKRFHIPYSGADENGIRISNNKIQTKNLFLKHDVPTPKFRVVRLHDRICRDIIPGKFPLIVKPAFEHCSIGITEKSVAVNYKYLVSIIKRMRQKYRQSLIIEEYIPGREFHTTVLEVNNKTVALPLAEMKFNPKVTNKWNIYGFTEKWEKDDPLYDSCHFISPPKSFSNSTAESIQRDSIRAFYALEFKDYARFDVRYNPKTKSWYFLDGNANAGFDETDADAMTASILANDMTLDDFILQIVKNSLHK